MWNLVGPPAPMQTAGTAGPGLRRRKKHFHFLQGLGPSGSHAKVAADLSLFLGSRCRTGTLFVCVCFDQPNKALTFSRATLTGRVQKNSCLGRQWLSLQPVTWCSQLTQCPGRQLYLLFPLPFLLQRFPLVLNSFLAWPPLPFHWWRRQELLSFHCTSL